MNGFESFIYMLGAITFASAISGGVLYIVELIDRPIRRRR